MSVEVAVKTLLETVVPFAFPRVAPLSTERPYAVYQKVGGRSLVFLGREVPSKKNNRFQVSVWADTDAQANALALAIENAFLLASDMQAEPLGSPVDVIEDELDPPLYGSRQDFSVWSDR